MYECKKSMNLSVQIGLYLEPDYKMTKIMREKLQSIEKRNKICPLVRKCIGEGGGGGLVC
jgi:hypothetical protein